MKQIILLILLSITNIVLAQTKDTLTIYYKIDESSIQQIYDCKLDSVAKVIKDLDSVKVAIYGFSDCSGTDRYNLNLTNARAKTVETYLLDKGINHNTISFCVGKGKVQSELANDKLLYDPMHRKVELILIKSQPPSKNNIRLIPQVLVDSTSLVLKMGKMSIGESLSLKNMNFQPGSTTLLEESECALKELLTCLREFPKLKIEIQGYTCCSSSFDKYSITLSIGRAKSIFDYLIRNGIDSTRMKYVGFGSSKPLVKEITDEDRKTNRRVEIKIIDK
jgi:outer membrane protein OmpA-like peptidoglycan-associated protein